MKNKTCLLCILVTSCGCSFLSNDPPECESNDAHEIIKKTIAKNSQYHFSDKIYCVNTKKLPEDERMSAVQIIQLPSQQDEVNCGENIDDFQRIKSSYEKHLAEMKGLLSVQKEEARNLEYRSKNNLPIIMVLGGGYSSVADKVMDAKNDVTETINYINSIENKYKTHLNSAANWVMAPDIKTSIDFINVLNDKKSENLKNSSFKNTFRGSGYRACTYEVGVRNISETANIEKAEKFRFTVTMYGKGSDGDYMFDVNNFNIAK